MKLYSYFRSSCSYRVRIALGWKGVEYETVPVHLLKDGGIQNTEGYAVINPMGQVPTLEFEEPGGGLVRLTQSVAILEYLEERYPSPPLLPRAPLDRARVRALVEICNAGVQPLQNLAVLHEIKRMGGDGPAFAKAANEKGLAAFETHVSTWGGEYSFGNALTLADVCLLPQIYSARRFGVDVGRFPKIAAIEARLKDHPVFVAAHPDRQPDANA